MSPELAAKVRDWIEAARSHAPDRLSRDGDAIRLYGDIGGGVYLRPDGTILTEAWDDDAEPVIQFDPRLRFAAIVVGAEFRPELRELLPPRPRHAENCPECAGQGRVDFGGVRLSCWQCGALGWWPPG